MGKSRTIEFNVDYGLNFTNKNLKKEIEKQAQGQIDLVKDYFENGGKVGFKINLANAIDLQGNAIDQKSITAFTQKYEKAMNAAFKTMVDGFKSNMSTEISEAVSSTLSSDINKLFSDMTSIIVDNIQKMQTDIMSALSGSKPVIINQEDLIKVKTSDSKSSGAVFENVANQIVNKAESELNNAEKNLEKKALAFRLNLEKIKNQLTEEEKIKESLKTEIQKRQSESVVSDDYKIKVGRSNYTKDKIAQIKSDENELQRVLSDFYQQYQKYIEKMDNIDDDINKNQAEGLGTSKLEAASYATQQKIDNISFLMKELVSTEEQMAKMLSVTTMDVAEIFTNANGATDVYAERTIEDLEKLVKESESKISRFKKQLEEGNAQLEEFGKKAEKTQTQVVTSQKLASNKEGSKEEKITHGTTREGNEKISARVQIYPKLNTDSFISQTMKAIEACEVALQEKSVEIPIKANNVSVGEFIADIQNIISDYPIQLTLDSENFASQIASSVKGVNIDINGSLAGLNVNNVSMPNIDNAGFDDDDFEGWEQYMLQAQDQLIPDEVLSNIQNAISGAVDQTKGLNIEAEQFAANIVNADNATKSLRETVKETADILVGETKVFDDPEIKILQEKIDLYEIIADLRKKRIGITKEESTLEKKTDKTDTETSRLKQLKEERQQRILIKKEWETLSPILENINSTEDLIVANEEKLQELSTLEGKKNLKKNEESRLAELKSQQTQIEQNLKLEKDSLAQSKQKLEIAKQQSSYFKEFSNKTLLDFQKEVVGNRSAAVLKKRDEDKIVALKNSTTGSSEYAKEYETSIKNQNKELNKQLEKLVQQDRLWTSINDSIKGVGKEQTLSNINTEIDNLNARLKEISKQKIVIEEKQKSGFYTSKSAYEDEKKSAISEEKKIRKQLDAEKHKISIIKGYSEEEISTMASAYHQKAEMYKEDLATQEGISKRINELRSKDIKSFKQYQYQIIEQEKRLTKQKSYNQQINEREQELLKSGVSAKDAKKQKYDVVKNTDYYSNNDAIEKYARQLTNIQLDLDEILRLMSEIDDLKTKLSSGEILSIQQKDELLNSLSKKRRDLEAIVSRTGWQSEDIVGYKAVQDFKKQQDVESSIVYKTANIDQFKQNAKSVKDIVSNIQKELELAEKENQELIASVEKAEQLAKQSKDTLALKYQSDAQKVVEEISKLREEKQKLQTEIEKSNNQEEIAKKQVSLGEASGKLSSLEKRNNFLSNPTKVQAAIDQEFESMNKDFLRNMSTMKSQITVNNEYISSLREMKNAQEELRRVQEPTREELQARKKDIFTKNAHAINSFNSEIQKKQDQINQTKTLINDAEQTANKDIVKIEKSILELTKSLDVAKVKLEELKTRQFNGKTTNQTNSPSDLYAEYTAKQGVFTKEKYDIDQKIASANSSLIAANNLLDKMSDKYRDGISRKDFLIKKIQKQIELEQESIQKQIQAGTSKDKIDRNNLNTLTEQLKLEQQKKSEMEAQYDLASELNQRERILDAARRIQRSEFMAERGKVQAQENIVKDIELIETLSQKINVNFGKVKTLEDKAGNSFKSMEFNTKQLDTLSNDIETYKNLINMKIESEKVLNKTKLPDESIYSGNKQEYAGKIQTAFFEEQRLYNEELIKTMDYTRETGELTEQAEQHLLNMYRYMQEYSKITGLKKNEMFNFFGIDEETKGRMKWSWKDAQDTILNKSDASFNVSYEIREQEKLIELLEEKIRIKELDIKKKNKPVTGLEEELAQQEKELENLKRLKKAAIYEYQKQKEGIIAQEQQGLKNVSSVNVVSDTTAIDKKEEKLEELAAVDSQVTQEQIQNQEQVRQKVDEATSAVENATKAVQEQNNIVSTTATTTVPSVIKEQEEAAQAEIIETDKLLQQQIDKATQAAKVSIAEGSSVHIAGDVKIDGGQFDSLKDGFIGVRDVAKDLLDVVKNIYTTLSNGTSIAARDIQSVSAPISNITTEARDASEAIEEVQVQLSKTGKNFEVISGGSINLNDKKFVAIKKAVDAMNKAIESSPMTKSIKDSGDITAKYYVEQEQIEIDGNVEKVTKEYVKLNSVFRDTEGQIIKLQHTYDVASNSFVDDIDGASAKIADGFTRQNKAIKSADVQMSAHINKLDRLKIKYETFDINNFKIDDAGNLVAKAGTNAEQIVGIVTGKTKELIKNVINQMSEAEAKVTTLKDKAGKGAISPEVFSSLSKELSLAIEKLDSDMNAVNRRINTQLEHTSRSWLNSWQKELSNAEAFMYNIDGSMRIDTSMYNATGLSYIDQYKDSIIDLKDMYVVLHKQGENFSQEQINNWKRQMQTVSDLKKKINSNSSKSYVNGYGSSFDNLSLTSEQFEKLVNNSSYARQTLSSFAKEIAGTDVEVVKLSKDNRVLTYTYQDQEKNIQTCKLSVEDYGKTIRNTNVSSQKHVGLLAQTFMTLKEKIKQVAKYFGAYRIFYKVINSFRNGITTIKELNTALTEMRKVSDESIESLQKFQDASFDIAKSVGTTAKQIQESTADFMRLGESLEQAAESAKVANILLNVSEFEGIDEATDSLVAMAAAYDNLSKMDIVDKLNEVGNNYAISTDGLASALQKSASALTTAGNDMDEAIALVTAGNAIAQDPDSVGAGLRTIALRITGKRECARTYSNVWAFV